MNLEEKKKQWRNVSIISGLLLVAMFILLFYSLTVLNSCLEKSIDDVTVARGVCTVPGLRSAASYNWVLLLAIVTASIALIVSIIKTDRIDREIQKAEEEEPAIEFRYANASLPDTSKEPTIKENVNR